MRLIDADELMEHVWRDKLDSRELIAKMINDAPTVKEIPTKIPLNIFEQLILQQSCEDCISRQEAINCVTLNEFRYKIVEDIKILPSVAPKEKTEWIPVKFRELTEEEKEELATDYGEELDVAFDCRLPDDGQEVLVSTKWGVEKDTFYINGYGMYFENHDADEVKAWMPLPEPYKAESEE